MTIAERYNNWIHRMKEIVEQREGTAIGPGTPVKLAVVLTLSSMLLVLIGVVMAANSTMTELKVKVDNLTTSIKEVIAASTSSVVRQQTHEAEDMKLWTDTRSRLTTIEKNGSDATRELKKELDDLRNEFRVYVAIQKQGKP